jgi:3-phosphoshikimate 1-carboxyvinyltransferase
MGTRSKERIIRTIPPTSTIRATVSVPGSKSITQRVVVAAALARGTSRLVNPLESEDTRLLRDALISVGIPILREGSCWTVEGRGGKISPASGELYLGNNGTGIRFLASVVALGSGRYVLAGTRRMAERPVEPLLQSLKTWEAEARSTEGTGCPPIEILARGLAGGETLLSAQKSSQFLSSLLLVAPYTRKPARISLDGPLVSRPYVDLTLAVMAAFGIDVQEDDGPTRNSSFAVPQGSYLAREYRVEGDASGASYFWAAAAVTGGRVTVEGVPRRSLQGDAAFVDILERMGCRIEEGPRGVTVQGPPQGNLVPVDVDMKRWPDIVPTLAVVAAFAKGVSRITNVSHLRIKETDRLQAVAAELSKLGAQVKELEDGLIIEGGRPLHGTSIETYDDHRIAMAFAVSGLRVPDIRIQDPDCVRKSFPSFWDVWDALDGRQEA